MISARLQKFDRSLEEAALNLGASRLTAVRTITIPYLMPAIVGAFVVAFLMSFENFNTTLMLVGSDAPLTIAMFDRLKEGSTPLLNAVSLLLMIGSSPAGAGDDRLPAPTVTAHRQKPCGRLRKEKVGKRIIIGSHVSA